MTTYKRIGVFGGTFDPIHNAHIEIARAVMASASLDVVLFVVSAVPPHKRVGVGASAELRLSMVESVLSGEDDLEPCDIELHRDGPSYMANTLAELTALHPGAELFLIVGLDSLVDIPNWRKPEEILNLAHILAVKRPDETRDVAASLEGTYDLVPFDESSISSTEIRRRVKAGEPLDDLVPIEVIAKINEGNLYV